MKLRKLIVCMLTMVGCILPVQAQKNLTSEQKAFQTSIMNFLKEEGFSPYIDSDDGSLSFKKEGELHWINIYEKLPFYVEFYKSGFNLNDVDTDAIVKACNYGNKTVKCAKAYMLDNSLSIVIEMFCHSAEEFKYVFYKNMKSLDEAKSKVKEYYNENPRGGGTRTTTSYSTPFTINNVEVANGDEDGNIITSYGSTIYDYKTKYLMPRLNVTVNTAGTFEIYIKLYTPDGSMSKGSTSPEGYTYKQSISMTTDKNAYRLGGWGGKDEGHWKMGEYRFEFYYKDKLVGQKTFKVL